MVNILQVSMNEQRKGDGPSSVSPQSDGQYTLISVYGFESGGSGDASVDPIRITSGPEGIGTETSPRSNIGLSEASKIQSTIILPLPTNLQNSFSNDWTIDEVSAAENIAAGLGEQYHFQDFSEMKGIINDNAINALVNVFSKTFLRKGIRYNVNLATNPHKEMFYNGPEFRTFSWDWEFAPISQEEAQAVNTLIYNLVKYSHPDFQGGDQSAYKYPETFEVEFIGTKIPKTAALALKNVTPNYTNSGAGPRFFIDGHPTFTSLSLEFIELIPLTKENIELLFEGVK